MEILFEDEYIIVSVKPVGKLSEAGAGEENSFADELSLYRKEKGEKAEIFAVHRLDRAVGGVMVYAKNRYSAAELSSQIQSGEFEKEYRAVVHGVPKCESGELCDFLFKDSRKNKSFVVKKMRKGVKEAKLEYETLKTDETQWGEVSLLKIKLRTGRSHQIRVQFASRKMPLVGDGKYGASDNCKIALWSYGVEFKHPKTKEKMRFTSSETGKVFSFLYKQ